MAEARSRGSRSVVQRTKPRVKRGVPGYLIAILILAGVGVGGMLFWRAFQSSAGAAPSGDSALAAARRYIEEGSWQIAKQQLEAMDAASPEERAQRDALLEEIADKFAQAELDSHNQVGTRYKDTKLGKYGDPDFAASGEVVWGNDLGDGEYNGAYQDDRHNQLTSDVYDTAHYEGVFLQYMRWLTVEDGFFDVARITADGEEVWSNWNSGQEQAGDHHLDDRWEPHAVALNGQGDDGELQIAWEIQSDPGLFFGGWNIDQVCIYAPATADNRLGISDFGVAATEEGVALSWTQPKHAPVTGVKVVRKDGSFPTDHTDGEVVYESSDITLEAAASAIDASAYGDAHYAIYATDGTAWLSWTREGFNAASVEVGGTAPGAAGCGCQTGGSPAGLAVGLFGLLALRRRRD